LGRHQLIGQTPRSGQGDRITSHLGGRDLILVDRRQGFRIEGFEPADPLGDQVATDASIKGLIGHGAPQ
jgi:hypothetical protein